MAYRVLIVLSLFCMATLSPAPIPDPRGRNVPIRPESTQEQRAAEQAFQGVTPEQGEVVRDTEVDPTIQIQNDSDAASVVRAAPKRLEASQRNAADRKVTEAGRKWPWALLMLAIGFCGVLGVRAWADRVAPPSNLK